MKTALFSILLSLSIICQLRATMAHAEAIAIPMEAPIATQGKSCPLMFFEDPVVAAPPKSRIGSYVSTMGLVLGSINGIVFTATTGNFSLIPDAISKWLVFFNETANVASTATGKKWIYSGNHKKIIDGVAIGAMAGQALAVGVHQGYLSAALTFATSMGLTYWFPNNYFHSIMHAIPKALPGKVRVLSETKTGQGAIGVSMIVVLEKILEHSHHLVQAIPHFLFSMNDHTRGIASFAEPEVLLNQALALFFMESRLPSKLKSVEIDKTLLHLAGASRDGVLFTPYSAIQTNIQLDKKSKKKLTDLMASELMSKLLTPSEISDVITRVQAL